MIDHLCSNKINIETVSIIDRLVDFIKPLLPKLNDPLQMKCEKAILASKYKYSLTTIDMKKMKNIVIKEFTF